MSSKKQGKQPQTAMMRIAIAGAGGFGYILAQQISQGANALLMLSSQEHTEFEDDLGVQVAVVDYNNVEQLRYTLKGVDLVISTISGNEQLNLIDAARWERVGRFVPSEFEGPLAHRPSGDDPFDRGSRTALELLQRWSQSKSHHMEYTVFSCGVLYERFAPGGLAALGISGGQPGGALQQGDYLLDVGAASGEVAAANAQGQQVRVCMTSVYDVARFVAAAVELGPANWPREFRMRGDQMTVLDIVRACSTVRRVTFSPACHTFAALEANIAYCQETGDWARWYYLQRLLATVNGRYSFRTANLNEAVAQSREVADVQPMSFRDWLAQVWGPAQ